MNADPSILTLVTLATVRGHTIEANKCTRCDLNLLQTIEPPYRDCSGVPVCLSQNGTTVVVAPKPVYVYVAGPLTCGHLINNVSDALRVATLLRRKGYAVYVPHANVMWEVAQPELDTEVWLQHDFLWVRRCDCLLRLPGLSTGADREIVVAHEVGIPVYYTLESLYVDHPVP